MEIENTGCLPLHRSYHGAGDWRERLSTACSSDGYRLSFKLCHRRLNWCCVSREPPTYRRLKMKSTVEAPDWATIPAPLDDGATRHLAGARTASVPLRATNGDTVVDLSALFGRVVVYAYPRTGKPGVENPDGWDMIPGARGCTPQSCSFPDHFAELKALAVDHLFGLSTQDPDYQREAAERLRLPFAILSDEHLRLTRAMNLPTLKRAA